MEILKPQNPPDTFFSRLGKAPERLLLLDYDGTLAPFTEKFDRAYPYPGVRLRLKKLVESGRTRTVIISGRAIDDLKALLGLDRWPELWGCHGAERFNPDTGYRMIRLPDQVSRGLKALESWAERESLVKNLERKPSGIAFHWRGLDGDIIASMRQKINSSWSDRVDGYSLTLHEFDGGLEFRLKGITKENAVLSILGQADDKAAIACLGDDQTDEDAFRALGERGLKVLVRPQKRPTAADLWIVPPDELYVFLDRWLDAVQ